MAKPARVATFPALLACGALGALACVLPLRDTQGYHHARYMVAGEPVLHRLPLTGVSWVHPPNADVLGDNSFFHLPAADVAAALLYNHWRVPPRLLQGACVTVIALLLLALEGLLLETPLFGSAAAAGALLYRWEFPHGFLTFYVLVVAGLLARFAQTRARADALRLALATGCSFLFRSSLAFLPPAAALLALTGRGQPRGRRLACAALLLLVPYLFTLPVTLANWKLHHRLIAFENGEASSNVVPGALGVVETLEGPWQALLPPSSSLENGPVLAWAIEEVLGHPLRYARACVLRAGRVLRWSSPWLALAFPAIWLRRGSAGFAALGVLLLYFLGIHCLMPVERPYFQPVEPLLILLACTLSAGLTTARPEVPEALPRRILDGALAVLLALAVWVSWLTARTGTSTLAQAVERSPGDWWLRQKWGEDLLRRGDAAGAAQAFTLALSLNPPEPLRDAMGREILGHELKAQLATAEMLQGRPERLWKVSADERRRRVFDLRCSLARAYALLLAGRRADAEDELRFARRRWLPTVYIRGPELDDRFELVETMRRYENFPPKAEGILSEWPPGPAARLREMLAGLDQKGPDDDRVRSESSSRRNLAKFAR